MRIAGFEHNAQYEDFARAVLAAADGDIPKRVSGLDVWRAEKERVRECHVLKTGVSSIDDGVLRGGLHTREITELVGMPGSCKTLLAIQTSLIAASSSQRVVYIDTCNSFSMPRVQCIFKDLGGFEEDGLTLKDEHRQILSHIKVVPSFAPESLLDALQEVHDIDASQIPRLVVIDSISSALGPYLGGKSDTGNKLLTHAYTMMRQIIAKHNLAILVTNSTSKADLSSPDCLAVETSDLGQTYVKPAMGNMWGHYGQHVRLFLKRDLDPSKAHLAPITAQLIKAGRRSAEGAEASMHVARGNIQSAY